MVHVYKNGGDWVIGKKSYTIKAINSNDMKRYLDDGWFTDLESALKPVKKVAKNDNKQS